MNMAFKKKIFRSYDIRGFLNEVTEEVAFAVGASLVQGFGAKKIVVGRDMRKTSPELMRGAMKGVTEMGADVVDIGLTNTSVWNFATTNLEGADFGIMITASHNPSEYNGIKVIKADGSPISGTELYELVSGFVQDTVVQVGQVEQVDVVSEYINKCVQATHMADLSNIKIVIDYGNGMGSVSIQPLIQKLGIEVVEMYVEPDADFPNHEANPAVEETLAQLKARVIAEKADFGLALDGDLDRLKVVDETGESVLSDFFLALLAEDVLKDNPGKGVVVTVNMGWAVRETIENAGGVVIESAVGRSNIPTAGRLNDGVLGGEVSGHFMFKDFHFLEAVDYAIVRLLSLYTRKQQTMSQLVAPFKKYAGSGEVNREVENASETLQKVLDTYRDRASQISELDGIKLVFAHDWWFSLRKSNTEPVVRLTLEATSEALMTQKRDELLQLIEG
ncbi:phosphomannomutase/phosphoglucomutase [Candidatus Uhrbacteria bacterium CG_4_10_14_0_2_um_filter_41_7]|uniref:Phosphomannomutase/phosphoglucomutase n=1 Tax=Candidatus Uhrbacteria bacterium CG_4_9_14_3_um_filter_41_35 TaxID=1975034 RepID=A0A2M7XDP0_9BACT|nr:MAG: phosphomannomutase/phosphoglucomutase [Candidatus Uhrbacteria bacterium CG11_big_fil_rev_8_21_14_0_20_41_9]PIZ53734.1 MAG: phosphomannomutase/phosphoglucomutase [Candidatus Uhrbacteria bacterium CG_4_10_14_0_2_um_filter_41_7]PJA45952.1 MAG: phosphomannomutase/phosphoglucomutase [Candidatus Uhrbacteria bacterium CG_4_9_14_3_um_filter_41_35]